MEDYFKGFDLAIIITKRAGNISGTIASEVRMRVNQPCQVN
jgi:hypothetical protein